MLCVDGAMDSNSVDTHSFLIDVGRQVENITGILFYKGRNASGRLALLLGECKTRMDQFITKHPLQIEKKLYIATLTIALKKCLESSVRLKSFPPNELFDVVEQSFRDFFESGLVLPRGPTPPDPVNPRGIHDAPGPYSPGEGGEDQATGPVNARASTDTRSGRGVSQDQYTILHNLHRRLSALEQLMGV